MTNEELLQIIEKAAKEKVTELYLSNNQFSSLLPEISQLSSLTTLYLDNNQLSGRVETLQCNVSTFLHV
ncbi:MAG: leucine-rich repeat domain-containing protein [Nostoc sp. CreGUA01]|nr:leucine-rich repeat domain-containing protein [Nostoc sp. CreGUA01]